MKRIAMIVALALLWGCGPRAEPEEPEPEPAPVQDPGPPPKPHVDVPPLSTYSWLSTANIVMGKGPEKQQMEAKLADYYSGLPMFMKVLTMATKDRNVGLRDNPAYLTDIWSQYLELVGRTEDDPPVALDEHDLGMCKYAIYRAWAIENPTSGIDNYEDVVTTVTYE